MKPLLYCRFGEYECVTGIKEGLLVELIRKDFISYVDSFYGVLAPVAITFFKIVFHNNIFDFYGWAVGKS